MNKTQTLDTACYGVAQAAAGTGSPCVTCRGSAQPISWYYYVASCPSRSRRGQ